MYVPHGHKQPAVLCILTSGDNLLLLERIKEPNKGSFTPVGGKMEKFETPAEAAIRETEEEAGIAIEEPRFRGVLIDNSPTKYNWICFVYSKEIPYHHPAESVEGRLHWIPRDDLAKTNLPPTDRYIYDYIGAGQPFVFNARYDSGLKLLLITEEIKGDLIYEITSPGE